MMWPHLEPWDPPLATGSVHPSPECQCGCDLEKMAWVLEGAMPTQGQQAPGHSLSADTARPARMQ